MSPTEDKHFPYNRRPATKSVGPERNKNERLLVKKEKKKEEAQVGDGGGVSKLGAVSL